MNYVSNNIFLILFADDTTMLIEGDNLDAINTSINSEFDQINIWLTANKLSLNVTNAHYTAFLCTRRIVSRNQLFFINLVLKFVGIIIDNKLNWISHISYIKTKLLYFKLTNYSISNFF